MSGPPAGGGLLDLLEPGWRRHLASGEPAGRAVGAAIAAASNARAMGVRTFIVCISLLDDRWVHAPPTLIPLRMDRGRIRFRDRFSYARPSAASATTRPRREIPSSIRSHGRFE